MNVRLTFLALVCAALIVAKTFAQEQYSYSSEAEKKFGQGIILFQEGRFRQALDLFRVLAVGPALHQRTTASYIMAAKSLFRLGEYRESAALLQSFLASIPESGYRDDAHYTAALDYYMLQRYRQAGDELILCLDTSDDETVLRNAQSLLEMLVSEKMDAELTKQLMLSGRQQHTRDFITVLLAERLLKEGSVAEAEHHIDIIDKQVPSSPFAERARVLRGRLPRHKPLTVGVMLPLMQKRTSAGLKVLAEDVLAGITCAVKNHPMASSGGVSIALDVRDTDRDTLVSQGILRELADKREVVGVIGPIFGNIVSVCSRAANDLKLPMISPTSTGGDIASTGPYVFQLSPDVATRGKAMARYAVQGLGYHSLAVLAPDDSGSATTARSFLQEAQRLGARIVAAEMYSRDSSDLREQFMRIRKAGNTEEPQVSFAGRVPRATLRKIIRAGADRRLVDSVRAKNGSIGVTQLFGPHGRRIADSLHLKLIVPPMTAEDIEIPTVTIQGIFVPIADPDEIGVVSSQLKFFNIQAQILGNSEWHDPAHLEPHRRDVEGAVFVSDFYIDRSDSGYLDFAHKYSALTQKQPSRYSLFGYDAMNMILTVIDGGAVTRESIASGLGQVRSYRGIHSRVDLTQGRVNSFLHVLKYHNGNVEKIGEVIVN